MSLAGFAMFPEKLKITPRGPALMGQLLGMFVTFISVANSSSHFPTPPAT